jgi:hypothetical protein
MKERLTLSVNSEVVRKAKTRARAEGASLSSIVEECLQAYSGETISDAEFFRQWAGHFPLPKSDSSDLRLTYLLGKYARSRE